MNVLKNKKIGSEKLNVLTFIQIIFFFLFPGKKKTIEMIYSSNTLILPGTQVGNFIVDEKIGSGGFGSVFSVHQDENLPEIFPHNSDSESIQSKNCQQTKYAMKVLKKGQGFHEAEILSEVRGNSFFPTIFQSGITDDFEYHVMELLGPSISIRGKVWKGLCQSKKMNIVKQMLKCIEELYQMNILHCDIKPSNFLFRNVDDDPRICLVDFGLAKKITDPQNMNNISHRANEYKKVISNKIRNIFSRKKRVHNVNANSNTTTPKSFCGTLRYASINVMDGYEPTLKDDLISWFYSITELLTGGLPWDGSHGREETRRIKAESTSQELCAHLPKEFLDIYQYLISLNEQPNFKWINDKLSQASFNYCNVKNTDNNMCMKVEYDMIGDCKSR